MHRGHEPQLVRGRGRERGRNQTRLRKRKRKRKLKSGRFTGRVLTCLGDESDRISSWSRHAVKRAAQPWGGVSGVPRKYLADCQGMPRRQPNTPNGECILKTP